MKKTNILKDSMISGLTGQIMHWESEGWGVVRSHQVIVTHKQKRFSGTQHKDTIFTHQYSVTIQKEVDDDS